jgi:hypothetical protein
MLSFRVLRGDGDVRVVETTSAVISYRGERVLLELLWDVTDQLEQRAREVTALNHMLQLNLLEWYKVAQEYREVLSAVRDTLRVGEISSVETDELGALIDNIVPTDGSSHDPLACWRLRPTSPAELLSWLITTAADSPAAVVPFPGPRG